MSPPGWLHDATGSYNLSFHVAGIPIIFGAVLLFFIPWAQRTSQTTNVMTAVKSSDDVEDTSLEGGAAGSAPADAAMTFATKPISIQPRSASADQDIVTIRSTLMSEMMSHRSLGSFLLVDIDNRRVMAYSQNQRDSEPSVTPIPESSVTSGLIAKAIDVLKRDDGSTMSLQRSPNALDMYGRSPDRFLPLPSSVTSSFAKRRGLLTGHSPRSVEFCLPGDRDTRPMYRLTPINSPPSRHSSYTPSDEFHDVKSMPLSSPPQLPATSPPSLDDRCYVLAGAAAAAGLQPPSPPPPRDAHFLSSPSNRTLTPGGAAPGVSGAGRGGTSPTHNTHALASHAPVSHAPPSYAPASRDRANTVEGGDNSRARSQPTTPPNEQDDVMFVMSDISLSDTQQSNSQNDVR